MSYPKTPQNIQTEEAKAPTLQAVPRSQKLAGDALCLRLEKRTSGSALMVGEEKNWTRSACTDLHAQAWRGSERSRERGGTVQDLEAEARWIKSLRSSSATE